MGKSRWGVILDAGSSGTRLHMYKWKDPAKESKHADYEELNALPKIKTKKKWTKKIHPGVSTFGDHPEDVGPEHLRALVEHAMETIPKEKHPDTPIFLMATAGMRLLPPVQQRAVLLEICSYFRRETEFSLPDCDLHIQVIPGETEGLYGWIAANYLLGGFDNPEGHSHGKDHHTYGFLDMGGASAQIAFAPNATEAEKHADDLKLLRMRTLSGEPLEYRVFSKTWLGYGVTLARKRYVHQLVDTYLIAGEHEVPDPCMPLGMRATESGELIEGTSEELVLVGSGDFQECLARTKPLVGDTAPCVVESCLLHGHHYPEIDFDVNHFVGVSEYWHTTHGVFAEEAEKVYDFNTYEKKVEEFCRQNWHEIAASVETRKDHAKDAQEACFKASWLISMLHDGIGIPRVGLEQTPIPSINFTKGVGEAAKDKGFIDPFQAVDKINDIEVSWTLGKMVLYAAGQVPPQDNSIHLPVGFGSNIKGIPPDFQYAGSTWNTTSYTGDDDDWTEDFADDLVDHVNTKSGSGFLIFVLILLFIVYIFRKRDRRMRFYTKLNNGLRRHHRRPGTSRKNSRGLSIFTSKLFGRSSHQYERVMEEGDAAEFELGDVDSSDGEHSDSSGGTRVGRTSGLATPKLNVESSDDLTIPAHPGSAINRGGLVVRTESRERLLPQMLHAGRKSRTGSPTRVKSPLMTPLDEV